MFLEALHKSPALRTKNPCFPPSDLKMSDGGEMGLPVANHSGSPRVSGLSSTGRRTMSCKCLLLTSAILVGWGLLGGYTFLILERDDEQLRIESAMPLENYMEDFLASYPDVNASDLRTMLLTVLHSYENGTLENMRAKPVWTLDSAIFFAFSILTTIGYGNIAPKTIGGRLFTILFGLFGIPLNLALIAACGTKVKVKSLDLTEKLYARYQCAKFRDRDRKILSLFSIIILGLLIFMAIPAVIFMYVEGWTFVDSLYYTFVTLTTIGIGDFVAGYGRDLDTRVLAVYRVCLIVWLFLGLTWLSTIFAAQQGLCNFCVRMGDEKHRRWTQRRRERSMSRLASISLRAAQTQSQASLVNNRPPPIDVSVVNTEISSNGDAHDSHAQSPGRKQSVWF